MGAINPELAGASVPRMGERLRDTRRVRFSGTLIALLTCGSVPAKSTVTNPVHLHTEDELDPGHPAHHPQRSLTSIGAIGNGLDAGADARSL